MIQYELFQKTLEAYVKNTIGIAESVKREA